MEPEYTPLLPEIATVPEYTPLLPEIATVPEYTPLLPGLAMVPTVTWSAAPELLGDAGTDAASTSSELGPGGLRGYVRGQ